VYANTVTIFILKHSRGPIPYKIVSQGISFENFRQNSLETDFQRINKTTATKVLQKMEKATQLGHHFFRHNRGSLSRIYFDANAVAYHEFISTQTR
jgi:hypothetical protein